MSRVSRYIVTTMMSLLLATCVALVNAAAAPLGNGSPQSSDASKQDKAKACNDLADRKGLNGQDRKTFMQNCLDQAANSNSRDNVNDQDKATACKNLADKKGLQGADRRSFVKDCMNRANP